MDDLVVDKNILRIHGYISESDEDSDNESKSNLDEIYERFKPSPIQIDPKIHKIIEVHPENEIERKRTQHSSYSSALKHNLVTKNEADVAVDIDTSEQKLSKSQRKRIRRKMNKSVAGRNSGEFSCDNHEENVKIMGAFSQFSSVPEPLKRQRTRRNKSSKITALKNGFVNNQGIKGSRHVETQSINNAEEPTIDKYLDKRVKYSHIIEDPILTSESLNFTEFQVLDFTEIDNDTKELTFEELKEIESNEISEDIAMGRGVKNNKKVRLSKRQRKRRHKGQKKAASNDDVKKSEAEYVDQTTGAYDQGIKQFSNFSDYSLDCPYLFPDEYVTSLTRGAFEELFFEEFLEMLENTSSYFVRLHPRTTNWIQYWCPGTGVCML